MTPPLHNNFFYRLEKSAVITFIGVILLFSCAVVVTLIAPSLVDPSWTLPASSYQVQMYEVVDPNIYISGSQSGGADLQFAYHLKNNESLLSFEETEFSRIVAPPDLEKYITHQGERPLKLTSRLLMLRKPIKGVQTSFNAYEMAEALRQKLQEDWEEKNPQWKEQGLTKFDYAISELYALDAQEGFAVAPPDVILENWISSDFVFVDTKLQDKELPPGVVYISNPKEYRIARFSNGNTLEWKYDPNGEIISSIEALKSHPLGFRSRAELISLGEKVFAAEGCWYCHTDQTRTLVQDVVANGSESYPAPPSSANEYIYQKITFPGTRRIGPDLSRVGVKRPSRDWHKAHFWSPKTASEGSIMPAFQHFFDYDPRGTAHSPTGVPNLSFEAIFQYLMTKGTRITPPTEAWWLGKDPLNTMDIIEGRKEI